MRRKRAALATLSTAIAFALIALPLTAQHTSSGGVASQIRDEMLGQFNNSSLKMSALSAAMPAELYGWAPGEGVMTVATVYAHIARYNFMYLSDNLGIPAPDGVDWQNLESLTDKDAIVGALELSIEHVKTRVAEMSEAELAATTELYGREVPGWAVLVQLVSHMNEHVGQSVSYARMNDIVPPWSR
ncbi:MAG: DinB family protein [Gemmatimonadota bacterium]|nr:DinB family protein [Gemmatimonadota bacterium]